MQKNWIRKQKKSDKYCFKVFLTYYLHEHVKKQIIPIPCSFCKKSFNIFNTFKRISIWYSDFGKALFLILSPFYSLCFLIPSQYFSTVSRHFSTIFNYCECIFPWNYFSVKKNPIFFTETSECIFPWNYFSNFHRIWFELVQVSGT